MFRIRHQATVDISCAQTYVDQLIYALQLQHCAPLRWQLSASELLLTPKTHTTYTYQERITVNEQTTIEFAELSDEQLRRDLPAYQISVPFVEPIRLYAPRCPLLINPPGAWSIVAEDGSLTYAFPDGSDAFSLLKFVLRGSYKLPPEFFFVQKIFTLSLAETVLRECFAFLQTDEDAKKKSNETSE